MKSDKLEVFIEHIPCVECLQYRRECSYNRQATLLMQIEHVLLCIICSCMAVS